MAEQITKLYAKLKPLFVKDFAGGRGGVAGGLPGNMDLLAHELSGPLHTGNLTWGRVDKAGASLADIPSRNHGLLTGIGPDDHHARAHMLASTDGLGADHTVSGLSAGQVLRAVTATSAAFGFLSHTHLTDVLPDQHHARQHSIISAADHTITTAQYNLVGASATNVVGIVQSSNNPGANVRILRSTTTGGLTLESLLVNGEVVVGQSLTAAATAFRVINHTHDYPHAHVVVNPGPFWNLDEQFGLDVDDNLLVRGYIVGKHAIQLPGAKIIVHFDGAQPYETNFTGNAAGHMGQVATVTGPVIYRPGKFGKAAQVGEGTTNLVVNPSFEASVSTGWSHVLEGGAITQSATRSMYGTYSMRMQAGTAVMVARSDTWSLANGATCTVSAWCYKDSASNARLRIQTLPNNVTRATATATAVGEWVYLTCTWTNDTGSAINTRATISNDATDSTALVWWDGVQGEAKAYPTAYCDGSLPGHAWTGTANNSASTRAAAKLQWDSLMGDLPRGAWSLMFYVYSFAPYGAVNNLHILQAGGDDDNGISLYQNSAAPGSLRMAWVTGGSTTNSNLSGDIMTPVTWHHVALTYDGANLTRYVDGVQIGAVARTAFVEPIRKVSAGGRYTSPINYAPSVLIDELVLADRVVDADEIRAIVESNAPVFAETSTWHWRSGRNRVYADAEGLWVLSSTGGVVLGVYAGDETDSGTKSWGGVTLGANDMLIGDSSRGGYVQWDDSEGDLVVAGQIMVQPGSSGIADFNDANLDNISDGSTYGRINKTIIGGGYILVGSGTKNSTLNGWVIDNTTIVGQAAGLTQVELAAADGKIKAGQGNVILERTGVRVLVDDEADPYLIDAGHSYQFRRSTGALVGKLAGYYIASGTRHGLVLHATSPNSQATEMELAAMHMETVYAPTAVGYARVYLATPPSGGSQAHVRGATIKLIAGNPAGPTMELTDGLALVNGDLRANRAAVAVGSTPSAVTGYAVMYVDSGDGDLKVRFANGTIKTIATD